MGVIFLASGPNIACRYVHKYANMFAPLPALLLATLKVPSTTRLTTTLLLATNASTSTSASHNIIPPGGKSTPMVRRGGLCLST